MFFLLWFDQPVPISQTLEIIAFFLAKEIKITTHDQPDFAKDYRYIALHGGVRKPEIRRKRAKTDEPANRIWDFDPPGEHRNKFPLHLCLFASLR
jgi:hypothetical protein